MLFAIKSVSKLQKDSAISSRINYLHATETSSSRSVFCIFGVVLLLEREPRRLEITFGEIVFVSLT